MRPTFIQFWNQHHCAKRMSICEFVQIQIWTVQSATAKHYHFSIPLSSLIINNWSRLMYISPTHTHGEQRYLARLACLLFFGSTRLVYVSLDFFSPSVGLDPGNLSATENYLYSTLYHPISGTLFIEGSGSYQNSRLRNNISKVLHLRFSEYGSKRVLKAGEVGK